jgi:hypothetical protein
VSVLRGTSRLPPWPSGRPATSTAISAVEASRATCFLSRHANALSITSDAVQRHALAGRGPMGFAAEPRFGEPSEACLLPVRLGVIRGSCSSSQLETKRVQGAVMAAMSSTQKSQSTAAELLVGIMN